MAAADWYKRKLAGGPPAAPVVPARPSTPPVGLPGQAPQAYQPRQQGRAFVHPDEVPANISEALSDPARFTDGTGLKAGKAGETYSCPECGSSNFFTRAGVGGVTTAAGRVPPAPICEACGYNGLFQQFGNRLVEE